MIRKEKGNRKVRGKERGKERSKDRNKAEEKRKTKRETKKWINCCNERNWKEYKIWQKNGPRVERINIRREAEGNELNNTGTKKRKGRPNPNL